MRVVERADFADLFAEQRDEDDAALGRAGRAASAWAISMSCRAAGVVIGAVEDAVSIAGGPDAQVVVVRGQSR